MATKKVKWFQKDGSLLHPETDWESIMGKPEIPSLSDYVKKTGDTMTGSFRVFSAANDSESSISALGITSANSGGEASLGAPDGLRLIDSTKVVTFSTSGFAIQNPKGSVAKTINLPTSSGTLALKSDITWANIPDKPTIPSGGGGSALDFFRVGYIYISYTSTSPASMFGGSWTSITGRFPYFNAGTSTGGSNTHTISIDEMPKHGHGAIVRIGKGDTAPNDNTSIRGVREWWNDNGDLVSVSETGGGKSFSIMPAYQTLYAWRRTA